MKHYIIGMFGLVFINLVPSFPLTWYWILIRFASAAIVGWYVGAGIMAYQ